MPHWANDVVAMLNQCSNKKIDSRLVNTCIRNYSQLAVRAARIGQPQVGENIKILITTLIKD